VPRTNAEPSPNTYHAHRERQRIRILEASAALFDKHGIDRVTMADITSASGLRASTMYQYFSNKDDIVWAIVSDLFIEGAARAEENMAAATTALSKITALLDFIADELEKNPAKVRFMAQFDAMYARNWPTERLLTLEAQISPQGFRYFRNLIREGILDGSLRSDLNPDLTLQAVLNAVIGAQRRLASLGSKVELEFGQPIDRLFREMIRIILLGLRAVESESVTKSSGRLKAAHSRARKRSS
jgi:AcrR family transcriptional regulator